MAPAGHPGPMDPRLALGDQFVTALATADGAALAALLHPDATLLALVPDGLVEEAGTAAVTARARRWFGRATRVDVASRNVDVVNGRVRASFRAVLDGPRGRETVEQHAFLDVDGGRVRAIRLACSGFMREEASAGARAGEARVHDYDAGDLGCASGLPDAFRRRLGEVPVGEALAVRVRDPSAKEDLPALARLLGHEVAAIEPVADGLVIRVVRRK